MRTKIFLYVEWTFSFREVILLGGDFLLEYPYFWQSWPGSDNSGCQNLTDVCETWHSSLCFAQGPCMGLEFFLVLTDVPYKESMHKLQFFSRIRIVAIINSCALVSIPAAHVKSSGFNWPWALCRDWHGLWFLHGIFLHFASVLEKKPLSKTSHPFLQVSFQRNFLLWQ